MSTADKLSVIHVVSSLNVGGAERFVIDLCQEQIEQQMTTAILSFGSPQDTLTAVCHDAKISLTVSSGKSWREQKQRLALLSQFDVIHIHSPAALKSLVFHLFLLRRKNIIYTRHGAAPLTKPHWVRVHRFARLFVNAITFVSTEAKQNFSHHNWNKVPQYVIDNGVRVPSRCENERSASVIRLGSVGRMISLKSQISLLKAVAQLSDAEQQHVELHFFGDGVLRHELELFYKQNLSAKAVFHGIEIDREAIYPNIEALVVTSSTEGLSMVILEAMAYGKAVIATNVGGNPVLVKDGQTGWLYEYDDIAELKRLLLEVIKGPEPLLQCGTQARQWVAEHYALSNTAKRYQALYCAK